MPGKHAYYWSWSNCKINWLRCQSLYLQWTFIFYFAGREESAKWLCICNHGCAIIPLLYPKSLRGGMAVFSSVPQCHLKASHPALGNGTTRHTNSSTKSSWESRRPLPILGISRGRLVCSLSLIFRSEDSPLSPWKCKELPRCPKNTEEHPTMVHEIMTQIIRMGIIHVFVIVTWQHQISKQLLMYL